MSKVRSKCSIAFLLSGPGIAVRIVGPCGSEGKKGWPIVDASGITAAATLAAGLAEVVTARVGR